MASKRARRKESEAALILKYEDRLKPPADINTEMLRWEDSRRYVHTDAMLKDTDDAVGTNFLFRNQQAMMALLRVRDAAPRIKPRRWLPSPDGQTYPQDVLDNARTHEIVIEYQQRKGKLTEIINGAIQDALTVPMAWIKMVPREDYDRDPLGYGYTDEDQSAIKRYERLKLDFDDEVFTEDAAEYRELEKLNDRLRDMVIDDLAARMEEASEPVLDEMGEPVLDENGEPERVGGEDVLSAMSALSNGGLIDVEDLPQVEHYRGFTWRQADPEDMRYDWNVARPEDLCFARWMAERVWMTESEIRERWNLDDDAFEGMQRDGRRHTSATQTGKSSSTGEDAEYGGKDPEERAHSTTGEDNAKRGDKLAVWEYHDRVQGRVFRWVQGFGRLLDSYTPSSPAARFFPFYLVMFNRATGKFSGPSDTDLQEPLQDESNRLRTWESEGKRASFPRWIMPKGLLRPAEKSKFEASVPNSITEVERADEIGKSIYPILPPAFNAAVYDRAPALREMQQMAGLPSSALGAGAGTGLATDSAIANEQMGNQVDDRKGVVQGVLADMYEAMAEINAQFMPEETVRMIAGPGASWPETDLQQLLSRYVFEADATLEDAAERGREMKLWVDVAQIAGALGLPLNPIPVTQRLMTLMGLRDNLGNYISVPALLGQGGPEGADGGSAPRPEDQGGHGAQGGHPTGQGMDAPPSPSQVPNAPPAGP